MQITNDSNEALSAIPSDDEIWNTIKKMKSLKAPGPDGMPPLFFKRCWYHIGKDIANLIKHCFSSATMPQ
ncbi:hypothetical protein MKX01_024914, partial [Papaver californicum]